MLHKMADLTKWDYGLVLIYRFCSIILFAFCEFVFVNVEHFGHKEDDVSNDYDYDDDHSNALYMEFLIHACLQLVQWRR